MRDFQHPSHSFSPLYKGFSEGNVRDEPKMNQHIAGASNCIDFAIRTWQNQGCVRKGIYLRVVKMPCTTVKDAC